MDEAARSPLRLVHGFRWERHEGRTAPIGPDSPAGQVRPGHLDASARSAPGGATRP
ncbi:hypothetical protein ACIQNT_28955 [Streptomyces luteogriseus]|uniref:hypothetical protein n=1 Tax=Streptomyces luteogriseus TaxID=68233 RepID=UPI003806B784